MAYFEVVSQHSLEETEYIHEKSRVRIVGKSGLKNKTNGAVWQLLGSILRNKQTHRILNWSKYLECLYRFSLCRTVCVIYVFLFVSYLRQNLYHKNLKFEPLWILYNHSWRHVGKHFGRRLLRKWRKWFQDNIQTNLVGFCIELNWSRTRSSVKFCFSDFAPLSCNLTF
jgi:hypothetical protein